ncbi:MAG: hypothetical protein EP340_10405 [Alphaproteobacteria bacterium]|nr:MAG: hypothetical protein EP340_10405 [Alphaproteobacteria bacterium]
MTAKSRQPTISRTVLLSLLALAFAVRSLVPMGFMPGQSDEGGFLTVQICDAYGGGLVTYDLKTGSIIKGEEGHKGGSEQPTHNTHKSACPFAAGALFENASDAAPLSLAFFGPPLLAGRPTYHLPLEGASQAPLPPRGPPARV